MYHNFLSGIKSILIFIDLPPGRATIYRAVPCVPPPPARDAHGDDHGTTSGTTSGTRAAVDVGPYPAPPPRHLVGRDVPGAPRARRRQRDRQRGRPRGRGPPGTSAPTTPHHRAHLVGRDVPGAPRQQERQRGHARERPRGTRAAETSAPTMPHHRTSPGRARRPRRAARTGALLSRFRKTLAFILDNPDGGGYDIDA